MDNNQIRINSYVYFKDTTIGDQLTYTFSIFDNANNMLRNGIRKSYTVKPEEDKEVVAALKVIADFLVKEEEKSAIDYIR